MPTIEVALVRLYRSESRYGEPFEAPRENPRCIADGDTTLEMYFGAPPPWLMRAEARREVLAAYILRAVFNPVPNESQAATRAEFLQRLATADKPGKQFFVENQHRWSTSIVLRSRVECADSDLNSDGDLWLRNGSLLATLTEAQLAHASKLDLIERTLDRLVPSVLTECVLKDRVYIATNDTFVDALGLAVHGVGGRAYTTSTIAQLEERLTKPSFQDALSAALKAPALGRDALRLQNLQTATRDDRLVDALGCEGKYELERFVQLELMFATADQPLVVAYIDMNGLKQINDSQQHEAGDDAIRQFSAAVKRVVTPLYRVGGDEFVIVTKSSAAEVAERGKLILKEVATLSVGGVQLSASIGITTAFDPTEKPSEIVARADKEMIRAKEYSRTDRTRPSAMAVCGAAAEFIRA